MSQDAASNPAAINETEESPASSPLRMSGPGSQGRCKGRWIKGEVSVLGDKMNRSFPPSPPRFRALALEEWARARGALWRDRWLMEGRVEHVVSLEVRRALPKGMLPALGE